MHRPVFIVGTGRCGSTMLSNMFRRHRRIASLSEFFTMVCDIGGRIPDLFPAHEIDGEQFWELISAITPRLSLALRHGLDIPEVLYSCHSPGARYSSQSGVPVILQTTLPHLSDEPDALFDALREQLRSRPAAPIRTHYDALFGWLTQRMDKQLWVERSGGAFIIIEALHATFTDARFIHIVRDGRDTALSIREHTGFRMFILGAMLTELLGSDPYKSADRTHLERIPPPLRAFLPESFDARAFRDYRVPLDVCGGLWSQQLANGLKVLAGVPAESVLTVRYEDFLAEPLAQLDRLTRFLGDEWVDADWASACAQLVRRPRSSWRAIPEPAAGELAAACQPGFDLLRSVGIDYP